jgi:hypothetical protein
MALGDVIARISVIFGLETAAFEKGSRKAQREVEGLRGHMTTAAKAISGALAGMVSWELVKNWSEATQAAIDFAGGLGETAQQLGVTTDELQEYRYVASQTGIEQAAMDKALQKTTRTLGELASPTKAQAAAMDELGLSAKSLEGLGTGDFLSLLADKFQGLSAAEQAALGAQLGLGRSFQTLIPMLNEGSEGIEKMRAAAHKLGIVISEEAIKNADANADLLTTYEKIAEAQKNATLSQPENVRAYMEYRKAVTDFQVGLHKAIAEIINFGDSWEQATRDFGKNSGIQQFFKDFDRVVSDWAKRTHDQIAAFPRWIEEMVASVSRWMGGVLGRVWNDAIAKIKSVGAAFNWLTDVVVRHSYVPEMVDGIAAQMARLDAVMVKPAEKAADATARKFQALRDLMDRLFPEIGKANTFNDELARIKGSGMNDNEQEEAARRAWRIFTSGSPFGSGGMGGPDFGNDGGPLVQGIEATEDAIQRLADKSRVNTVRIADSFKDMANDTLSALSRVTNAVQGGGFLSILESVIGFGLQLGSMGVFGKTIAGNLNSTAKVKGFAAGTLSAPKGLALVGERGPELVSFRGGERVFSNRESGSMMGGMGGVMEIRPSPLFEVYVDGKLIQAAPAIASAGGQVGIARTAHRRSRQVG